MGAIIIQAADHVTIKVRSGGEEEVRLGHGGGG